MELPELPEADVDTPMGNDAWTREQMIAYALEAVRAERERQCAALQEATILLQSLSYSTLSINNLRNLAAEWLQEFAAAIRAQGSKT